MREIMEEYGGAFLCALMGIAFIRWLEITLELFSSF